MLTMIDYFVEICINQLGELCKMCFLWVFGEYFKAQQWILFRETAIWQWLPNKIATFLYGEKVHW